MLFVAINDTMEVGEVVSDDELLASDNEEDALLLDDDEDDEEDDDELLEFELVELRIVDEVTEVGRVVAVESSDELELEGGDEPAAK